MSDIKFEMINGTLCRMVKPEPLTLEATFPCVVTRREDGDIGRYTKLHCSGLIGEQLVVKEIIDGEVVFEDAIWTLCELPYLYFEIIGYPVEEGSAEWALHQLMQGIIVRHLNGKPIHLDGDYMRCGNIAVSHIKDFLSKAATDGWQIYKEPEQPKYKVGDWVECNGNQRLIEVIGRDLGRGNYYHFAHGFGGAYANSITRKLSPSEIIVKIGCLEGKVEDLSYADNGRFFLIGKATERHPVGMYSILYDEMLDTNTRELVKSLLEAMRGDKMRNPCKFCGAKPVKKIAPTVQLMWLQCKNCKSKNMTTMEYNMESATARWNENNPPKESKESTSPSRKKL